ncbi:MAG: DsbC family protein [Pseudomonadota bacterium]
MTVAELAARRRSLAIRVLIALATVLGGGVVLNALAAEAGTRIEAKAGKPLLDRLLKLRPNLPVESVTDSPIPGIVALNLPDGSVYYGTTDGRYLFAGDLFRLDDDDLVNLAERNRADKRRALMADVARGEMVSFAPTGPRKAAMYVFTDVDCGFCRKLHLEVPELNAMGVEVNYLAYPRAGIGSESYDRIVSAWCADDPQAALTALKSGKVIPPSTCSNPVASQYQLGQSIGISGTPAIVLEDGRLLPGYLPAAELAKTIGI